MGAWAHHTGVEHFVGGGGNHSSAKPLPLDPPTRRVVRLIALHGKAEVGSDGGVDPLTRRVLRLIGLHGREEVGSDGGGRLSGGPAPTAVASETDTTSEDGASESESGRKIEGMKSRRREDGVERSRRRGREKAKMGGAT